MAPQVPGYLAGLATVVAVALLLRASSSVGCQPAGGRRHGGDPDVLGLRPLGAGLVLAGFAAVVVHLRRTERPGRNAVAVAAVLACLTVLLSWPGALGGALFWTWLWRRRGFDRVSRWVMTGWLAGAAPGLWLFGSVPAATSLPRQVSGSLR